MINLLLKIIKLFFTGGAVIVLLFVLYVEFGYYFTTTKEERQIIIAEIKAAPPLPDNFVQVYNKIYPERMQTGFWRHFVNDYILEQHIGMESANAAYAYSVSRYDRFTLIHVSYQRMVDKNTSEMDCLEFNMSRIDLLHNIRGVREAARHYYYKELEDLSQDEIIEIIATLRNPSLFNKARNPAIFNNRVAMLKKKLAE